MAGIIYADYYTPAEYMNVSRIFSFLHDGEQKKKEFFKNYCPKNMDGSKFNIYIENEKDEIAMLNVLAERFFQQSPVSPQDISHLIYASPYNAHMGDIYVPYVLHKLCKFQNTSVMRIDQQCVSAMGALEIAAALVDSGKGTNIMIACLSREPDMEARFLGNTIVGDGAGLMIVGKDNGQARIIDYVSVSDGSYSYNAYHNKKEEADFLQDVRRGTDTVTKILRATGREIQDIKVIIPQNVNYSVYYLYTRFLGIEQEKMYLKNIFNGGHLRDVDTIKNYVDAVNDNTLQDGDQCMLFGSGTHGNDATYNAILLEYCR